MEGRGSPDFSLQITILDGVQYAWIEGESESEIKAYICL